MKEPGTKKSWEVVGCELVKLMGAQEPIESRDSLLE